MHRHRRTRSTPDATLLTSETGWRIERTVAHYSIPTKLIENLARFGCVNWISPECFAGAPYCDRMPRSVWIRHFQFTYVFELERNGVSVQNLIKICHQKAFHGLCVYVSERVCCCMHQQNSNRIHLLHIRGPCQPIFRWHEPTKFNMYAKMRDERVLGSVHKGHYKFIRKDALLACLTCGAASASHRMHSNGKFSPAAAVLELRLWIFHILWGFKRYFHLHTHEYIEQVCAAIGMAVRVYVAGGKATCSSLARSHQSVARKIYDNPF